MSIEEGWGYSRGNCAHCHEQHASIGGAEPDPVIGSPSKYELFKGLFVDQDEAFCYGCHKDPNGSVQFSMYNQYNYSRIAGGDTTITCPDGIKQAFQFVNPDCSNRTTNNCGTTRGRSHCLEDIQSYLKNKWNFGSVEGGINPCSGCHNPHRAKYDSHGNTYPRIEPRFVGERLVSSVSRPSQHSKDNNVWQLWGDDPGERMSDYTALYQAPCRYPQTSCNSTTGPFEPDGSTTSNGSNLFNTVDFCRDCHQNNIPSTLHGTLNAIDWVSDRHGQRSDSLWYIPELKPYMPGYYNYVLSCLDCHEPHGSPNVWMLREEVNGTKVSLNIPDCDTGCYYYFCGACHDVAQHMDPEYTCTDCHTHPF